jgi:GNAT superfamily N-acetyltransferase
MSIAEVPWQHAESLRSAVLGWPPGPVPGDDDASAVHLAELDPQEQVTAVASYLPHPCPDRPDVPAIYLWGMAVAPPAQRLGAGRRLISEVLSRAARAGATVVWLDARVSAVGFYERCGGAAIGEPYHDAVTGRTERRVVFAVADAQTR